MIRTTHPNHIPLENCAFIFKWVADVAPVEKIYERCADRHDCDECSHLRACRDNWDTITTATKLSSGKPAYGRALPLPPRMKEGAHV